MYQLTGVCGHLDFWFFARSRMLLGLGLPLIFPPIITASYDGFPAGKTDMASALINAARNSGRSIGVSLASNILAHREQFHLGRLGRSCPAVKPAIKRQRARQTHLSNFKDLGSRVGAPTPQKSVRKNGSWASSLSDLRSIETRKILILLRFLFIRKDQKPNDINERGAKSDRPLARERFRQERPEVPP